MAITKINSLVTQIILNRAAIVCGASLMFVPAACCQVTEAKKERERERDALVGSANLTNADRRSGK